MIEILFDHSYEDDYYMLSDISVKIADQAEKERIESKIKEINLEGIMEFPDVNTGSKMLFFTGLKNVVFQR